MIKILLILAFLVMPYDLMAQNSSLEDAFEVWDMPTADVTLDKIEVFSEGTVSSGALAPCIGIFIYHPATHTLVASHLSEFSYRVDRMRMREQFKKAGGLFPLNEAYLYVTGVAGPLDILLERRRRDLVQLADEFAIPQQQRTILWSKDDHIGIMIIDTGTGEVNIYDRVAHFRHKDPFRRIFTQNPNSCEQIISHKKIKNF